MKFGCFIAGTDTGVGKTRATVGLCRALAAQGLRVAAMKPVASGAERIAGELRNEDATALLAASNVALPYELANPYCFEPAVSAHLAARDVGATIDPGRIRACYGEIAARADVVLVEGAGGWLAPIGPAKTMADVACALALPVVLIVGLRLGCLNHAALTAQAVRAAGVPFAGWIANAIDATFQRAADNVDSLQGIFGAPPLAQLPYGANPHGDAARLQGAAGGLLHALSTGPGGSGLGRKLLS